MQRAKYLYNSYGILALQGVYAMQKVRDNGKLHLQISNGFTFWRILGEIYNRPKRC